MALTHRMPAPSGGGAAHTSGLQDGSGHWRAGRKPIQGSGHLVEAFRRALELISFAASVYARVAVSEPVRLDASEEAAGTGGFYYRYIRRNLRLPGRQRDEVSERSFTGCRGPCRSPLGDRAYLSCSGGDDFAEGDLQRGQWPMPGCEQLRQRDAHHLMGLSRRGQPAIPPRNRRHHPVDRERPVPRRQQLRRRHACRLVGLPRRSQSTLAMAGRCTTQHHRWSLSRCPELCRRNEIDSRRLPEPAQPAVQLELPSRRRGQMLGLDLICELHAGYPLGLRRTAEPAVPVGSWRSHPKHPQRKMPRKRRPPFPHLM